MKRVVSCISGLALYCLFALPSAHTQAGKSRVVELYEEDGLVELVGLRIAGQKAQVLDYILADKDWLKALTLRFRNKHSRSIVHMRVGLEVEKQGNMEYPYTIDMMFGERPLKPPAAQASESPDRIAPNKEKELKLSDETYDSLLHFMRENQVDDIERVKVYVDFVVFDDDLAWSRGNYLMLRDPNKPGRWNVKGGWQGGRPVFYGPKSSLPSSARPGKVAATGQCNSPPYRAPAFFTPAKATRPLFTSSFITAKFFPAIGTSSYRNPKTTAPAIDDVLPTPTCIYKLTESPELCGTSPCSGITLYCTVMEDVVTRNKPDPLSPGGVLVTDSKNCIRPRPPYRVRARRRINRLRSGFSRLPALTDHARLARTAPSRTWTASVL